MAEEQQSAQQKTEEPTPYKLHKSREQGQVARSRDLVTTVSLLCTLLMLKLCAGFYYDALGDSFRHSYANFARSEIGLDDLPLVLLHSLLLFVLILLPLLLAPVLVVVLGLIPGGWAFSSKNFMPQLSRLDPIRGLKRIVSLQNLSELLKSILKVSILLTVAGWQLLSAAPKFMALQRTDTLTAISGAFSLAFNLALVMLLVFLLFALIDIPLQRFLFRRRMRMTKQEVKEEQKQQEGRPEVKARIKQLQRQLAQRQINKVLKEADVVVTNPTHYAIAIKYDPRKAEAPYVVAKGVDELALYIRKLATAYDLEVVELPPLARAIYYSTRVNQQIPVQLYTAVAHVLSYIVQLRAWKRGQRRSRPQLSRNIPVPESLIRG